MADDQEQKRFEDRLDNTLRDLAFESAQRSGVDVYPLLQMSVGRVMKRQHKLDRHAFSDVMYIENNLRHIRDWLVGAMVRSDPWLDRRNPDGVPLKLVKFGTLSQIEDEADKAMRRLASKGGDVEIESLAVHTFANGYSIVQLRTSAELEAESAMMQHCVGQGAYHGAVEADTVRIFSLRDRRGKAHATIELDPRTPGIEQVKGKQNVIPKGEYFDMVSEWLATTSYRYDTTDHPPYYAVDKKGTLTDLRRLPPGKAFEGSISIDAASGIELPENLMVIGNVDLYGSVDSKPILRLPEGLVVQGHLSVQGMIVDIDQPIPAHAVFLKHCDIRKLPEKIGIATTIEYGDFSKYCGRRVDFSEFVHVGNSRGIDKFLQNAGLAGDLHLKGESATLIPDGLTVGGNLKMTGNSAVFFDGSLTVRRSVTLNDIRVEGDPTSLHVGGNFTVHRSKMRMLPDDTVIGGYLSMTSVEDFRKLPGKAIIHGSISIDNCPFKYLEGRTSFKSLDLNRTSVTTLEPGTVVEGDLRVKATPIRELPSDLVVGRDLVIGTSDITSVPRTIKIGRSLSLAGSSVTSLPEGLIVPGDLDVKGMRSFTGPMKSRIMGNLDCQGSGLRELPENITLGGLYAAGSDLKALPPGLDIEGNLDVRSTAVKVVPEGMSVGGSADLTKTSINVVPSSVFVGGELSVEDNVVVERRTSMSFENAVPRFG